MTDQAHGSFVPLQDRLLAQVPQTLKDNEGNTSPLAEAYRTLAGAYTKLCERFDKVLAISDKYQELVTNYLEGCVDKEPSSLAESTNTRPIRPTDQGSTAQHGHTTIEAQFEALRNHSDPLVRSLVSRYEKSMNRMNKILTISDNYQAELRETSLRLELLARTDSLTGLANRRDMIEHLEMEMGRLQRSGNQAAIVMFDIDDFKAINDNFGHAIGDKALIALSQLFKNNLRRSDYCARWGGEEFLILLPDTTLEAAMQVADKLRLGALEIRIELLNAPLTLSISGGVSQLGYEDTVWESAVQRADQALYQAKQQGKNKVLLLP